MRISDWSSDVCSSDLGGADLLERDARVEKSLDDLEDQDVAERVEPLRARTRCAAHGGLDQAGAGPVVELAVGDAGGIARGRPTVAQVAGQRRHVVGEEQRTEEHTSEIQSIMRI